MGLLLLGCLAVSEVKSCLGIVDREAEAKAAKERAEQEERSRTARAEAEGRERRAREAKERMVRLRAEDQMRPTAERAKMVLALFKDPPARATAAEVCRARELLGPIHARERGAGDVAKAFALFRSREATVLQRLRAEEEPERGIVCADGWGSSCRCHGNHRGCCSHHGGIAGCTPLPAKVECSEDALFPLRGY